MNPESRKINFIKLIYGLEKVHSNTTIQYGNKKLVAWSLCGFPTLEELENKHNDTQILELFEQQD